MPRLRRRRGGPDFFRMHFGPFGGRHQLLRLYFHGFMHTSQYYSRRSPISLSRMLRLATRRVARPLASAVGRRGLCAPAETAPVLTEIRAEIESMKAQIAMKPDESLYTADSFDAALKSGKVDMSMLSSTLDTIDPAARKLAMKCVSDANMMAKTKESEEAIMADYDWSVWEKKGLDPETIAEVKAIMEKGIADEAAMLPELMKEQGIEELEKSVKDAFNGPDGFLEVRTPPPPPSSPLLLCPAPLSLE